ncbi:MAG TPA: DUF4157 domain-containing protein [Puia sp.]|nr:DUF4157 domain-containing protein [Puia sp.]
MGKFSRPAAPVQETGVSRKSGVVQPKLPINAPGDRYEQEADAMAERVSGAGVMAGNLPGSDTGMVGGQPAPVSAGLVSRLAGSKGGGVSLPRGTRDFMENAFSADFSRVRLHRDQQAAEMNNEIQAKAFTNGNDIYFNQGEDPENGPGGKQLLAHELTHVVQQSGAGEHGDSAMGVGEHGGPAMGTGVSPAAAGGIVQRQPAKGKGAKPAPVAPVPFSVDQATYIAKVNDALTMMTGQLVGSETLASTVLPLLQSLVPNIIWQDAAGKKQGGAVTKYPINPKLSLNLSLVLNDDPNPTIRGEFISHGPKDGVFEIFIGTNDSSSDLATTLYHESMHLMSWLINRDPPALKLASSVKASGIPGAVGTLDLSLWTTQIAVTGRYLDRLAQSVNTRRDSGTQIKAADTDKMARWLMGEIGARIETEVFAKVADTQQHLNSGGMGTMSPGTGQNVHIREPMIDQYVFDLSKVFLPADRVGLTSYERDLLTRMMKILEGIFLDRVARRFDPGPYLNSGTMNQPPQLDPTPLTPPDLSTLPLP